MSRNNLTRETESPPSPSLAVALVTARSVPAILPSSVRGHTTQELDRMDSMHRMPP